MVLALVIPPRVKRERANSDFLNVMITILELIAAIQFVQEQSASINLILYLNLCA